jgi:hypothetical protein
MASSFAHKATGTSLTSSLAETRQHETTCPFPHHPFFYFFLILFHTSCHVITLNVSLKDNLIGWKLLLIKRRLLVEFSHFLLRGHVLRGHVKKKKKKITLNVQLSVVSLLPRTISHTFIHKFQEHPRHSLFLIITVQPSRLARYSQFLFFFFWSVPFLFSTTNIFHLSKTT